MRHSIISFKKLHYSDLLYDKVLESLLFSKVRARNIAYNSIWRFTGFFNLKRRNSRLELNIHSKKKKKKKT